MLRLNVGRAALGVAVLLMGFVWCGPAHAETKATPPLAGHMRAVAAQPVVTPPLIDGVLSEQAWTLGATADGFWVSERQQPSADQTRVVVLYDDTMLYFAFTCLDGRPELIRASQTTRDGAPGLDDRITVELDPYHNHRSLSRFTVTARGTQSDAIGGGRASNFEGKGKWTAAATRTPDGWTAEIAIPLEMLEFDPTTDTFGINFRRYQNRSSEWSEWADLTSQRLLEEAGHLTGLRLSQTAVPGRLAVKQYVSAGIGAAGDTAATGKPNNGVDGRYQWRGTMTSVASVKPDFSGTDADVPGIAFSHTEKFVRDRGPFFQEGEAFFGDRELFQSGRIEEFDLGVKTFGRVDDYQVGVLATTANTGRADYVGRIVREVGPAFNMSATLVGTDRPTIDNNTLQVQAGGRVGRHLRVEGDVARSSADRDDGTRRRGEVAYHTSHAYSGAWMDHTDADYLAASGFLPADLIGTPADLIGTEGRGAYGGYNHAFGNASMRRADASMSYDVRDTTSGLRQRETASFYAGAETSNNVQLKAGTTVGSYRPRGAVPGEWRNVINDDRYYLMSAYYQSPAGHLGYGAQYSWGVAGEHQYDSLAPSLWLAPSPHLSLSYSFERADNERVQHQHVLAATWVSGTQSFATRWVDYDGGYYRVSYRRVLTRSVDAFGVFTSDPYDSGKLNMKLIWTLLPFERPGRN